MKITYIIVVIAYMLANSQVLFSQSINNNEGEYFAYLAWKNELDQAESDFRKHSSRSVYYQLGGALGTAAFASSNMTEPAIATFVLAVIGYVSETNKKRLAQARVNTLKMEGQNKDWLHGPPRTITPDLRENKQSEHPSQLSISERLQRLQSLRDSGLITEEEYLRRRRQIIEDY